MIPSGPGCAIVKTDVDRAIDSTSPPYAGRRPIRCLSVVRITKTVLSVGVVAFSNLRSSEMRELWF